MRKNGFKFLFFLTSIFLFSGTASAAQQVLYDPLDSAGTVTANGGLTDSVSSVDPIGWLSNNQDRFSTGLVESQVGFADHRAFTYDQAISAIAFTKSGDAARARRIFDRMAALQESLGYWRSAYYASTADVWEWNIDTGPIAWMVTAINYYEAKENDSRYAPVAEKAISWLETRIDSNPTHGTYGALNLGENFWNIPDPENHYGTEHQFDAYSAFKNRAILTTNDNLKTRLNSEARNILSYLVRAVWKGDHFERGFDDPEVWLDAQSWAPMALGATGPNGENFVSALNYAYDNMRRTIDYSSDVRSVNGFSYNNYQDTIWVEGTLQMAAVYYLFGDSERGDYFRNEMARTVRSDGGLPYSFDDSGTGEDNWPLNLRYSAVSSAAWYYFAKEKFNPFEINNLFSDVPIDYWAYDYITAIYNDGITMGCAQDDPSSPENERRYCPEDNVTRGQMAAFIIRAKYGEDFSYTATPYFTDVPSTNTFFKYVQKLRDDGITAVSGTYAVDSYVTRGQMAAFIIRAKHGENFSYTTTPYFSDVPLCAIISETLPT